MAFLQNNAVTYGYDDLDEAFPPIAPGVQPMGSKVLFQLRTPKKKTKGGILLLDETRETDHWNTQVAKVVAVGPLAFKNRATGEGWPEGAWCQPGDFVRVPKYGGDRWSVKTGGPDGEEAVVVIFNDLDISAKVKDPLSMKAFL